jgi:hypothetical protein
MMINAADLAAWNSTIQMLMDSVGIEKFYLRDSDARGLDQELRPKADNPWMNIHEHTLLERASDGAGRLGRRNQGSSYGASMSRTNKCTKRRKMGQKAGIGVH